MRVVVDTNVFVSAALKASSWPGAVVVWLEKNGGLLKTAVTEQELFEVMVRPRFAGGIQPLHIATMRRIFARAETVPITETVIACRDPKDDKFLELALNGHADVVVSGDANLLMPNPFRGVPILSPATFSRAMIIGRI